MVNGTGATPRTRRAPRDEGFIAYEDSGGSGPTVLCLPSIGDTRSEYRAVASGLRSMGARVLTADLRGHGGSAFSFTRYELADHLGDLLAVLDDAGVQRAVVAGCSLSAATGILAAAEHPERVEGLLLLGPSARPLPGARWIVPPIAWLVQTWLGARLWPAYYRSLFRAHRPDDLDQHLAHLRELYGERSRRRALAETLRAIPRIRDAEAFWARCQAPAAVVMGTRDPDHRNPGAEAQALADGLGGESRTHLLEGVGHYPHLERPERVLAIYQELRVAIDGDARLTRTA